MPRNVSLLELRTWARSLSETRNNRNITDTELTALANRHLTEVYDRLVDAGPADYYAATAMVTTSDGVIQYPVEADFRNLVAVYAQETADQRRMIPPMGHAARGRYKAPTGVWTVEVEYIPAAPVLEDDGDTFDGVSGWEELIVNLMARDVMVQRQDDPSVVMANIARLESRMQSRARMRDRGGKQITDMDEAGEPWPYGYTGSCRLACYRLRADNIELYEPLWGVGV